MLTVHNEHADGLAVTLYRVHDVEDADAPPIPSGEVVTIIEGVGRDKGRQAVWALVCLMARALLRRDT
jgi:hypothetical protein